MQRELAHFENKAANRLRRSGRNGGFDGGFSGKIGHSTNDGERGRRTDGRLNVELGGLGERGKEAALRRKGQLGAADNLVLVRPVEFDEATAPTPNANYQVAILLRIFLRVEETVAVNGVELHLRAAPFDEKLDEPSDLFEPVVEREDGVVQFERQRAAVDDAG